MTLRNQLSINGTPASDPLAICVRAFVPPTAAKQERKPPNPQQAPSEYTLIIDTETTTDAGQQLRFGVWQWRKVDGLIETGIFYHPTELTKGEQQLIVRYAKTHKMKVLDVATFRAGLDWAFCDTDSMAIAKPDGMDKQEFYTAAESVRDWFAPLNPYENKEPLFKIEDVNYRLDGSKLTDKLAPLFCLAISDKRYALFNIDADGKPIIRKASAHGLGHLLPPYGDDDAPASIPTPAVALDKIGVERWQYDLWYQIILAALEGHPDTVRLDYHPALNKPAASR